MEEFGRGLATEPYLSTVRAAPDKGKIIATTLLVLVQSVVALLLGVLIFHVGWPASHWASVRRSLSQERLYWWSLRWVGRLGRLPVAWSLAAHWCWSMLVR